MIWIIGGALATLGLIAYVITDSLMSCNHEWSEWRDSGVPTGELWGESVRECKKCHATQRSP
jgi:hypothetical protein